MVASGERLSGGGIVAGPKRRPGGLRNDGFGRRSKGTVENHSCGRDRTPIQRQAGGPRYVKRTAFAGVGREAYTTGFHSTLVASSAMKTGREAKSRTSLYGAPRAVGVQYCGDETSLVCRDVRGAD